MFKPHPAASQNTFAGLKILKSDCHPIHWYIVKNKYVDNRRHQHEIEHPILFHDILHLLRHICVISFIPNISKPTFSVFVINDKIKNGNLRFSMQLQNFTF